MDCPLKATKLLRWGPFKGCAAVRSHEAPCDDLSTPEPFAIPNNLSIKSKPSCGGDPPKILRHTGSISTLSFPGISSETSNFFNPYTSVAVGKNYILQAAGTQIGIY